MCRSGSRLRRQRPRGPLQRRRGDARPDAAHAHARGANGHLPAVLRRCRSQSVRPLAMHTTCQMPGAGLPRNLSTPIVDCDGRLTSSVTRPSARSEFGWRRASWPRRRQLQKSRSRGARRRDVGPSVPTRGTRRRTTHPLAAQSDHQAQSARLDVLAPLRIAAHDCTAADAPAAAARPAPDQAPPPRASARRHPVREIGRSSLQTD